MKSKKIKSYKIIAAGLALAFCITGAVWHFATPASAAELSITGANVQGFTGAGITDDGKLVGAADASVDMGVFVTGGSADKYNASNMHWHHNGDHWDCTRPSLFEGANSSQKIYAYSPFLPEDGSDGVITVTASEQTDWLVATATDLTASKVNLTMTHALTKIVVNPTFGTDVTTQTIAKIEVGDMCASGDLSIAENTWSNLSTADTTLEMKNNELLVIPTDCASFTVTVTMEDGRVFTTTVSLATVDNKLEAGTQYNIALQVGQDKVNLGGITAEPWGKATGGVLETE